MTILPFLAITFGAGAASLLTRRNERLSVAIGILGLVGALIAAAAISDDETIAIGGGELVGSAYLRLFAWLGSLVALVLAVLGLATSSHRHTPGVLLAGVGAAGLALALPDARIAVIAATAGGLVGILVTLALPATARDVVVAARELRALAIAGGLAILATAWIGRPLEELAGEPAVFGLAYLGFAVAVAIRFGAIPFHFWVARLADAAPEVALPMLMAWSPAAFAVVALAWADQSVAPLLLPLTLERALIVVVGVASVVLGSLAAWIQDDLEHVVGYTIIADAGIAIIGLAALDPAVWEPARTWILAFVVARSAFAAWAVAVRSAFGTRRIDDLRGWALRAPILAVAFVAIVVASIGLPGLAVWEARVGLIDVTIGGPIAVLVTIGALGPLAIYARLAAVGIGKPGEAVARGLSERPTWPNAASSSRPGIGRTDTGRGTGRAGQAMSGGVDILSTVPAGLRANRALIAAVLVVVLAGISLAVSVGGFGVPAAARAVPGLVPSPAESEPPGAESEPPAESSPPASESEPPASPGASSSSPGASGVAPSASPEPSFQPLPST
jgi:NADH:ubiquinone oxidoreductase subunit 2 (subunit N)